MAKIPVTLEAGTADGKLAYASSIYDTTNDSFIDVLIQKKYEKPSSGIPLSDLSTEVTSSILSAGNVDDVTLTKDMTTSTMSVKDRGISYEKLDETLYNDIIKLRNKVFPLEISLSFEPSSLQEKGTIATVSMSWEAKIDGTTVPITSATLNGELQSNSSYTESISDNKTYALTITSENRSASTSRTVTFVSPIYVGFDSHTEYVQGLELNLSKQGLRTSLGTLTVNTTNDSAEKYFWILSPYVISHIKTSSFEIIDDFNVNIATVNDTTYNTYRLTKPSAVGSFIFELS